VAETETNVMTAVRRLVLAAQPEQVILFGSRARGEAQADSDFDLLIVETEPFGRTRSRLLEIARLERALGALPIALDILVYSRDEAERFRHSLNHVVGRAFREGAVLYARS
jgi:predicted nucleotidyltransferase